jgi:hypothetical protein
VGAVSALGVNAQARGDVGRARQLFNYAQTLSRRDLTTQLWAIEDAVQRGDVARAVHHYDIALRASNGAAGLLFPVLGSAISEPAVRDALTATLRRRPRWGELFVEYVAANGPDPAVTARLFVALQRAGLAVAPLSRSLLINTLAKRGAFEQAWTYYASVHTGANRRMSRNPQFVANSAASTVFDWVPVNADGLVATMGGNGTLDFSAPVTVGGTIVTQMQMLPSGAYRLDGRSAEIRQASNSSPYWTLTCADGRELGRVLVNGGGVFSGRFVVPDRCAVQSLTLVARPSDAVGGLSGQIESALLRPLPSR